MFNFFSTAGILCFMKKSNDKSSLLAIVIRFNSAMWLEKYPLLLKFLKTFSKN